MTAESAALVGQSKNSSRMFNSDYRKTLAGPDTVQEHERDKSNLITQKHTAVTPLSAQQTQDTTVSTSMTCNRIVLKSVAPFSTRSYSIREN